MSQVCTVWLNSLRASVSKFHSKSSLVFKCDALRSNLLRNLEPSNQRQYTFCLSERRKHGDSYAYGTMSNKIKNWQSFPIDSAMGIGSSLLLSKDYSCYKKCSQLGSYSVFSVNSQRHYCSGQEPIQLNNKRNKTSLVSHSSSLKRMPRKKIQAQDALNEHEIVSSADAYATAKEYDLETLKEDILKQGLYTLCNLPKDANDALFAAAVYNMGDEPREICFFREGSVVFWNMPEAEKSAVLKMLRKHEGNPNNRELVQEESDSLDYCYTEGETNLIDGIVTLKKYSNVNPDEIEQSRLEKYAFSNALSLTVKLEIWEAELEKYVDKVEYVTDDLKSGKDIRLTRNHVLQKTGNLLTLRHSINLGSDLLDPPDFYWDREELGNLYMKAFNYLNITKRTKVMNEKLTHCLEVTDLLLSQLNDRHSARLEVIIIVLIALEVLFELIRIYERWSTPTQQQQNVEEGD